MWYVFFVGKIGFVIDSSYFQPETNSTADVEATETVTLFTVILTVDNFNFKEWLLKFDSEILKFSKFAHQKVLWGSVRGGPMKMLLNVEAEFLWGIIVRKNVTEYSDTVGVTKWTRIS